VNRDYSAFVRDTGRDWVSPDGGMADRQNAPATYLTWHDAMAYCAWLTDRWRAGGTIGADEHIRLPTEPEWERASRGDQNTAGSDGLVYPWGTELIDDATNCEERGFNGTCSVGLFPKGRSPYGCYDMAGQAWEWCTTLWGEDMATPAFKYPWCDDGREALVAPAPVRRVLRGGCFSSGRPKACCTYRGSLEPAGFWRGNGFRIVVVAAAK
jgi:gamma-glutamyl hercynylcysteine S-oxide synthase